MRETGLAERFVAMGTRVECHLFGPGDGARVMAMLRAAIEAVDDALTIHRHSPATLLNEQLRSDASARTEDVILWDALVACDRYWRMTGGLFDISAGMASAGWHSVTLKVGEVHATHPIAFDFGGIGKGIALDACRHILAREQWPSALVSLGESSILVHGQHPLGGDWPLAIPHPYAAGQELLALSLTDRCVSISSTIGSSSTDTVHPDTGAALLKPCTSVATSRSGAESEAISTALLLASATERAAILQPAPDCTGHVFDFDQDAARFAAGVL